MHFTAAKGRRASGLYAREGTDHDGFTDHNFRFKDSRLSEPCPEMHSDIVTQPGFAPSPMSATSGAARKSEFQRCVSHRQSVASAYLRTVTTVGCATPRSTAVTARSFLQETQGLKLREERIRYPSTFHSGLSIGNKSTKGECTNHVLKES
jgi:hypothetical protein